MGVIPPSPQVLDIKDAAMSANHDQHLPSPSDSESEEPEGMGDRKGSKIEEPCSIGHADADPICYGRVKDPEAMVSKTWWKSVFGDGLYLQTDGDVVEDPAITLDEVRMLESRPAVRAILERSNKMPLSDQDKPVRVLELCCGQGRHAIQLAELYPNLHIYGHDQSQYLIGLARSRAQAANLIPRNEDSPQASPPSPTYDDRVQFTVGDCRFIPHADNQFDFILMMGNSFGYFSNDQEDVELLKEIYRVLRPGGVVVLDLVDGAHMRENYSPRSWE
ncbi:hypothetical protein BGZ80_009633 [Entomortierella chlamydospora]|uniref:Methyltransferase domain-containing protein n=1 Tax=Entomortierella chlamydospora TaxID=101097 RepID=A0A9P6MW14_9FUNG|nr:hypothetical protein BGZ79_005855 [Entomortierella chlamydospora]KAG0015799.1 hypothetical protein BGZ80_009633 [Entomortierella chlamydospora]